MVRFSGGHSDKFHCVKFWAGKFFFAVLVIIASTTICRAQESEPLARPNFVFFLVDDLGWADVGCFGSTFHETPNIDRLCSSGMKFNFGYAASPVCSPTRASILTGRHPVRVGITDWIPGMNAANRSDAKFKQLEDRDSLALDETTIAEVLKAEGYATFFAGKWHLGPETHWPTQQGFDFNIGGNAKGSPPGGYYSPWNNPTLKANHEGEYLTERLTEETIRFLSQRDDEQPFLIYLSYYNIHTPVTAYEKQIEHFQTKAESEFEETKADPLSEHEAVTRSRQDNPKLASMVSAVDDSVGAVLAALHENDLNENTVVIFCSDNGGLSTLKNAAGPGCNLPLRAGKGWLYEGGIRIPMIIRAPGTSTAGTETNVPVSTVDFFPTMLELAGTESPAETTLDGTSLLPLMKGEEFAPRPLHWHYPHYHGSHWSPGAAILEDGWKLIEFYHYGNCELYNLNDDPNEQNDLSESFPEQRIRLQQRLVQWQSETGAMMPEPADR